MKLVRENIDFKRGISPKRGLGIGRFRPEDWDGVTSPGAEYMVDVDKEQKAIVEFEWEIAGEKIFIDDAKIRNMDEYNGYIYIKLSNGDLINYVAKEKYGRWGPDYTSVISVNGQEESRDESDDYLGQYGSWILDIMGWYKNWIKDQHLKRKIIENINFKRGIDPKKSLRIGEYAKKEKPIDWDSLLPGLYKVVNIQKARAHEIAYIEIKAKAMIYITEWGDEGNPISLMDESGDFNATRFFNPTSEWVTWNYIQKVDKIGKVY